MPTAPQSPHRFHIPVMGSGFTIDTPIKVAPWGIDSVISLVDDDALEVTRAWYLEHQGAPSSPIRAEEPRARQRRVTAWLDLVQDRVDAAFDTIRRGDLRPGSPLRTWFELLPACPARTAFDQAIRDGLLDPPPSLLAFVRPGRVDVNIMTKLDRSLRDDGQPRGTDESDAVAALIGFAGSRARGAIVFSAGFNPRLFAALARLPEFRRDHPRRKEVILKVSDFRSAAVQARYLAKSGIAVDEFRVESPINCGGHAFVSDGRLLGDILQDFVDHLPGLALELAARLGLPADPPPRPPRLTVQGGLGLPGEADLLLRRFDISRTGWGSLFLLVPEVCAVDPATLEKLEAATESEIVLSGASPLGVPFWNLSTSESEQVRQERIAAGHPGSPCFLGHIALEQDPQGRPVCRSSRSWQRATLARIGNTDHPDASAAVAETVARACICYELGGTVRRLYGTGTRPCPPMVCPGPNLAYFPSRATFREMVDHIYGRGAVQVRADRPHFLLKEAMLYLDLLSPAAGTAPRIRIGNPREVRDNVVAGLARYSTWGEPGLSREAEILAARATNLEL